MKKVTSLARDFFTRADILLLVLCTVCTVFGIVVISSATLSLDTLKNVYVQILSLFVGLGLFVLFTYIDIDTLGDNWVMLTVFNVVFLLILIPLGVSGDSGNNGWLRFCQRSCLIKNNCIRFRSFFQKFSAFYGNPVRACFPDGR